MCLRLDYPNLQQQVLIPPTIEKTNAVTHCLRNHISQHFFMSKISEPAGRQKQTVINNTQIELQASDCLLEHHCSHRPAKKNSVKQKLLYETLFCIQAATKCKLGTTKTSIRVRFAEFILALFQMHIFMPLSSDLRGIMTIT